MVEAKGYALQQAGAPLEPYTFERREPGPEEVLVELHYCGICHTDLTLANNEMNQSIYPMVPGHEMVGKVVSTGDQVSGFAEGDWVCIGCIIDSCRHCEPCTEGDEQHCVEGFTLSFNSLDREGRPTFGGYSSHYTVDQNYLLKLPEGLDPARTAPLLCGGITVYTPLKRFDIGPGKKVGVLGLGGLGHLAVKFAAAMGAHVVMLTSSPHKAADAEKLGAKEAIITSDNDALAAHTGSFDLIINTVSAVHDINAYLMLLKRKSFMALVGAPTQPLPVLPMLLLMADRGISGSLIGGLPSTREMLEFCAEHNIGADIELVSIDEVNEAWERIERNDVKYRFVIDLSTLR
jgi:uncharacterized zinc-type alcohol dehydrogenase-like protein